MDLHPFRFHAVVDQARSQKSQSLVYTDNQLYTPAGDWQAWSRDGWAAKARWIEDLGYTTLLVPDHMWLDIAPIPALALVAETTSLRLGTYVLNVDLRHPALLAKDVAMLDVLSGGRVELGLGCGAIAEDYTQIGVPFDRPGVRVGRFEEAVHIIKRFFTEEKVTFSGQYYQVTGLQGHPKPHQQPHPPIWIGGGGKRLLSFAAREADCIVIGARSTPQGLDWASATFEANLEKIAWIREAAGERLDHLEFGTSLFVVVPTEDRQGTAEEMAGRFGLAVDQFLSCIHILVGTVDQMVEDLLQRRELYGISSIAVAESALEGLAPVLARLISQ